MKIEIIYENNRQTSFSTLQENDNEVVDTNSVLDAIKNVLGTIAMNCCSSKEDANSIIDQVSDYTKEYIDEVYDDFNTEKKQSKFTVVK